MHGHYFTLDERGEPQEAPDLITWGKWFETADRHLASDRLDSAAGEVHVSTVFLGTNHNYRFEGPPVLWETMVFGGPLSEEQERYSSRKDALAGHAKWLALAMQSGARTKICDPNTSTPPEEKK